MEIHKDKGACKINGGGFAGSIICVVPNDLLDEFCEKMAEKYTKNNVKVMSINPLGAYIKAL
jgi:galactokinase